MLDKIKSILNVLVFAILLVILFINGTILIDSLMHKDEVPSFFGWKPLIVLSGSMEDVIYSGDLAIVKEIEPSKLKKDDIIAFRHDEIVIIHRIVDVVTEDGVVKYKTKGDSNQTADKKLVLSENIEGIYHFRLKGLGNLTMFVQTPLGIIVCLSIPLLGMMILETIESSKEKKYTNTASSKEKKLEKEIEELKQQNEELKKKQR